MDHRTVAAIACALAAAPVHAEVDGEEFLSLMRQPSTHETAQKYIDNAADKWDGSGLFCTPEADRENARFRAVLTYLEAHPQELWRPRRYLIIQGLRSAFPCKASPGQS